MAVNGQPLPDWDRFEEGRVSAKPTLLPRTQLLTAIKLSQVPGGRLARSNRWYRSKTALLRILVRGGRHAHTANRRRRIFCRSG